MLGPGPGLPVAQLCTQKFSLGNPLTLAPASQRFILLGRVIYRASAVRRRGREFTRAFSVSLGSSAVQRMFESQAHVWLMQLDRWVSPGCHFACINLSVFLK